MPIRCLFARICLFSLLAIASAAAQAPEGIPRDLARFRAQQIKDVSYQLNYNITSESRFHHRT